MATAPTYDEFRFSATCSKCGGKLEHENASRPGEIGARSTAVVRCARNGCRRRWFIVLTVHAFDDRETVRTLPT